MGLGSYRHLNAIGRLSPGPSRQLYVCEFQAAAEAVAFPRDSVGGGPSPRLIWEGGRC